VLQFMHQKLRDATSGAFYGGFFAPQEYYLLPAEERAGFGESCIDPVIHAKENALAAQALLDAYRTTGSAEYCDQAVAILGHLWERMWDAERGIARNWDGDCDPVEACDPVEVGDQVGVAYDWGWLPDQTAAARAFVQAYETTGAREYLDRAQAVADHILRVHHDPATGGFWDSVPAFTAVPLGLLGQRQEVLAELPIACPGAAFRIPLEGQGVDEQRFALPELDIVGGAVLEGHSTVQASLLDRQRGQGGVPELAEAPLEGIGDEGKRFRPENPVTSRRLRPRRADLPMSDQKSRIDQAGVEAGIHEVVIVFPVAEIDLSVKHTPVEKQKSAGVAKGGRQRFDGIIHVRLDLFCRTASIP